MLYALNKLALVSSPHPHPYNLAWLNHTTKVLITDRVQFHFSMDGLYSDTIWCDVVPMNACHVLLGRPW